MFRGIKEDSVAATKVELFERIRRDSWREGLSVRALARKYGMHQRLVRGSADACRAGAAQDGRLARTKGGQDAG